MSGGGSREPKENTGTFTIFEADGPDADPDAPAAPRAPTGPGIVLHFTALDGTVASASLNPGANTINEMSTMICCPCCVGGGCRSPERRAELRRMLTRFSFWLSLVQLGVFFAALAAGGGFASVSDNAQLGPTPVALVKTGAVYAFLIKTHVQVFRLVTPLFLHAGLLHLVFNLFAQMRLGVYAEARWGTLRYVTVYVISGVAATLTSAILSPDKVSTGASSGIMGVIAAFLVQLQCQPDSRDPLHRTTFMQLALFLVLGFVVSLAPYVDFGAHLGATCIGSLLGLTLWLHHLPSLANCSRIRLTLQAMAGLAIALFFIISISVFMTVTPVEDFLHYVAVASD